MAALNPFAPATRIVLKIGSALLVDAQSGNIRSEWLTALARDIKNLAEEGLQIIIVSSGAIALGRQRLGLTSGVLTLPQKQACAAAGQAGLTQAYEHALSPYDIVTAQALLTLNDTENRRRWLNARSTLDTLLSLGAVPIINENDTVATDEIRYGDNDRLAARTAQMVGADTLILLSDIDGLYSADPRKDTSARHIAVIEQLTPDIMAMAGPANHSAQVGTGGMVTKLAAAKIATDAGAYMCIMNGTAPAPLARLKDGARCSWFKPRLKPRDARRQWIGGSLKPKGQVTIDAGAEAALRRGKSLLAAGITSVSGRFRKGDAVVIINAGNVEIARGLAAYDADDTAHIIGVRSADIPAVLGYDNGAAFIHRDNLVLSHDE